MSKRGSVQASGDGRDKPGGSGPSGGFSSDGKDLSGSSGGNLPNRPGGGFFTPGRMIGGALGGLAFGPIGGILGGIIGNQMGRGRYGYTDAQGNRVSAARDMVDGGGPGRYGDRFQGGPFSGLLNAVGARPAGYRARQEAAGPGMDMAEAMAAPALTGTTPATTAVMPPAPTIPPVTPSNAFPGMYASDYQSMTRPSLNPAFAGSGMTPAPAMTGDTANYVPMRSMPTTGQAPTTPADQMTAMSERAMDPMERAPMVPPSIRQDLNNYFRGVLRGTLGGVMGGPAAGLLPGETWNRLPAGPSTQQGVAPPSAPSTMASPFGTRAMTPYEEMRARAAGGGITYTQPGSLRPVGVLP